MKKININKRGSASAVHLDCPVRFAVTSRAMHSSFFFFLSLYPITAASTSWSSGDQRDTATLWLLSPVHACCRLLVFFLNTISSSSAVLLQPNRVPKYAVCLANSKEQTALFSYQSQDTHPTAACGASKKGNFAQKLANRRIGNR